MATLEGTVTINAQQQDLLQYANDARDFDGYIYMPGENTPPADWTKQSVYDSSVVHPENPSGLYFETWTKGNTTMFVIRGTEFNDAGDRSNDLQMLTGQAGQQNIEFCQYYQQHQNDFAGKRVIFTGNSSGASDAEAAAVVFGKEAIGTNGYGTQPVINKLAEKLGLTVSNNPSDFSDKIINFNTQTDAVGNAGTHFGKTLYVPGPDDIWQKLSQIPTGTALDAFLDAYYHFYDGHLPNNFNGYNLTNPSGDSRITDTPSATASFFHLFGEALRTLLSGKDPSTATISFEGPDSARTFKIGLGQNIYTFNANNTATVTSTNQLSDQAKAQIVSALFSGNSNLNQVNINK